MPRGIPGSGPNAGRGNKAKGRKTKSHTLADIAARSGNSQSASAAPAAPAATPLPAAATTGRGRGRGRATTPKSNARRGTGKATGQRASKPNGKTTDQRMNNGQQRAGDQPAATTGDGNGIKIEIVAVPGRGGRPQQSEAFPFAQLELTTKGEGGELVGPSFLIPDSENPDNVLAAARKRHKGKTFTARKMEGGVRIWRLT
jgi:hypothetical protein